MQRQYYDNCTVVCSPNGERVIIFAYTDDVLPRSYLLQLCYTASKSLVIAFHLPLTFASFYQPTRLECDDSRDMILLLIRLCDVCVCAAVASSVCRRSQDQLRLCFVDLSLEVCKLTLELIINSHVF